MAPFSWKSKLKFPGSNKRSEAERLSRVRSCIASFSILAVLLSGSVADVIGSTEESGKKHYCEGWSGKDN